MLPSFIFVFIRGSSMGVRLFLEGRSLNARLAQFFILMGWATSSSIAISFLGVSILLLEFFLVFTLILHFYGVIDNLKLDTLRFHKVFFMVSMIGYVLKSSSATALFLVWLVRFGFFYLSCTILISISCVFLGDLHLFGDTGPSSLSIAFCGLSSSPSFLS